MTTLKSPSRPLEIRFPGIWAILVACPTDFRMLTSELTCRNPVPLAMISVPCKLHVHVLAMLRLTDIIWRDDIVIFSGRLHSKCIVLAHVTLYISLYASYHVCCLVNLLSRSLKTINHGGFGLSQLRSPSLEAKLRLRRQWRHVHFGPIPGGMENSSCVMMKCGSKLVVSYRVRWPASIGKFEASWSHGFCTHSMVILA